MKWFSRSVLGLASAGLGAVMVIAALQFTSVGKDATNPPPKLNLQETPINRDTKGVTSFAPIIKRAASSVVNIYSTRIVRERQMSGNPLFDDPTFRRFFGPNFDQDQDQQQQQPGQRSRPQKSQGLGSGVIISGDGYILTANHVVEGADEIKVGTANGGRELTAKVIGTDPATDIAVLRVEAKELPAITIADSDKLEVGDVVLAIGNPFGVGQTVTMGIVSGVGRTALGITDYENFIQTDAAINPGNSGGALVDAEGRLVGINTAIFSRSGGYQGVGFAVPANMARYIMERLIKDGKVTRGYLGVNIQTITPDLAQEFNLPDQNGAIVTELRPNAPAAKSGLKSGDVIREVDGKKITDSSQLRLFISQTAPGSKVTMKVLRSESEGGKPAEKTITTTLGELPENAIARGGGMNPDDEGNAAQDSLDGVEVSDLDARVRRQFRVPSNVTGAAVTNVDPNSDAAQAGLRPGDVILEIARKPVTNAEDAVELSRGIKSDKILLRVWRNGGTMYVIVDNSAKAK